MRPKILTIISSGFEMQSRLISAWKSTIQKPGRVTSYFLRNMKRLPHRALEGVKIYKSIR